MVNNDSEKKATEKPVSEKPITEKASSIERPSQTSNKKVFEVIKVSRVSPIKLNPEDGNENS